MNDVIRGGERITAAVMLRDAALALLEKSGKPSEDERGIWFQQHTPANPQPHLSLCLLRSPNDDRLVLNVWCMLRGKYVKALNIEWKDEALGIVTFRRGEWERELLAMGRARAVH